jgi:cytoskeletal protein CcmA (bactofilin family)
MSIFGKKPEQEKRQQPAATPVQPAVKPQPQPQPQPQAAHAPSVAPQAARATPPAASEKRSFLGTGCSFTGELAGDGSFECTGSFEGNIKVTGDVVIGHGGTAKAELKARRISIEGRLLGDAIGAEKVEVGTSGHVEGDVKAPAVQFSEGAFFEGNVEMRRSTSEASAGDRPVKQDGPSTGS